MSSHDPSSLTDLHSHLVPGVDDGARTVEDTLEGVGRLWDLGYRTLATTPHFDGSLTLDEDRFRKAMGPMDQGWEHFCELMKARFPDLVVFRGHEVMLDVPNPDLSDRRLHLAEGPWVLVEWPRLQIPPGSTRVLERLVEQGYRPLIAHPERYHGIDPELSRLHRWKEAGAALQVNLGSLVGRYGDRARTMAFRLLRRGWVDCFSTDFHGRPHLEPYTLEARHTMTDMDGEEQWRLLTIENPSRIVRGKDPLPVNPLEPQGGFWERVRGLLGLSKA